MLHIFPPEFEKFALAFAQAYPDEIHEFHVWENNPDYVDIFNNWEKLDKTIKVGHTVIYSAAIHHEGFGQWICQYRSLCPTLKVVGIIAHGLKDFQPFSLMGCLRFCREEGAEVFALLGEDHKDKFEYYRDNIGFKEQEIDLRVVSASFMKNPKQAEKKKSEDPHAPKINTIDKVMASTSGDYFQQNRGGSFDEVVARGEIWETWEGEAPHSVINAHWAGFPLYMQPSDILLVGNLVQWWKPQVIVEFNAWKMGMTAFLLQMSEDAQSRIVAINAPAYVEKDASWAKKLIEERKGANERVSLVHIHPDDPKNILDPYTSNSPDKMMFLVNYHSMRELVGCARIIFQYTHKKSVILFHATTNRDVPKFLRDFRRKPGVHGINIRYSPPEGSWYQDGVFIFDKEESAKGEVKPTASGGVF